MTLLSAVAMPKAPPLPLYNHNARPTASTIMSHTFSVSGRRFSTITTRNAVPLPPPTQSCDDYEREHEYSHMDMDYSDETLPAGDCDNDESHEEVPGIQVSLKVKAKRYENSDVPLTTWIKHRQEYLDECMGLEGRGWFGSVCAGCRASFPQYRCRDCMHGALWCQKCLVVRHHQSPLHHVEMWNSLFFQRSSLRNLGLRVQLGHAPGRFCPTMEAGPKDFVVIHTNGIHKVDVNFCRCLSVSRHIQLLRIGWWPATPLAPRSCATMECLRQFHTLNLQGKITCFSYYRSLEYLTDNTGLSDALPHISDRLESFQLMVQEYRHIKMAKRAGRAFDPDGIIKTAPGSLAIPCRACPVANINLPKGWENVPPARAWLYMLIVAMDANFRLRSRLRAAMTKDPTLGLGWAYFVDYGPYSDFIKDYVDQEEARTCVGFQALLNMLTKKSKGLRATGIAAVSCARHQLFRPLGMGDLQKGEHQCNMDYLFCSSVVGVGICLLCVSYDVGCQWFTNFWRRMVFLPGPLKLALLEWAVRTLVPKFHLQSHKSACHSPFSFNYCSGAGRTEGEGVERNWDELNPQAASTAEMNPGHHWLTLDDCAGWVNFRKTMGLGNLLLRRMLLAIKNALQSSANFENFDKSLRSEIPDEVAEMERRIIAWENDKGKPDPYQVPRSNVTLAQVRLAMAEEEKQRVEDGLSSVQEVGVGAFIIMGLDIQMAQQALHREVRAHRKQTVLQTTVIVERRTVLLKRIQRFREIQHDYMPGFDPQSHDAAAQSSTSTDTAKPVEECVLWLPSDLNTLTRRMYCAPGVVETEDRLRFAEATDALERLRHHLRTRSFTNRFKIANITGQIRNTRARTQQAQIDEKVHAAELQYCRARKAVLELRGPGEWEKELQILWHSDVRALNERELTQQEKDEILQIQLRSGRVVGEDEHEDELPEDGRAIVAAAAVGDGQRRPSWIWFTGNAVEDMQDPLTKAALGVEWAKARARANRWEEEVVLLNEEMRRVLVYCNWKAAWWREQKSLRESHLQNQQVLISGLHAYAEQQAAQEESICTQWTAKWSAVRQRARPIVRAVLGDEWDDGNMEIPLESEVVMIEHNDEHDEDDRIVDFE